MLYSLSKLYSDKVLSPKSVVVTEEIQPPIQESIEDVIKSRDLLATSLRNALKKIDEPAESLEQVLENVREEIVSALIDSGVEKD